MQAQFEWYNLDGRRHATSILPEGNEEKVDTDVGMLVKDGLIFSDIYGMGLW